MNNALAELKIAKRRHYGIENLDPSLQGEEVDARGTLLLSPRRLVTPGRVAMVEPYAVMREPWEAIAATGDRRRISHAAQNRGERVFVNLSGPKGFRAICMLGVPSGWRAFATTSHELAAVRDQYEYAKAWAGCDPVFVVFGASDYLRALCWSFRARFIAGDCTAREL